MNELQFSAEVLTRLRADGYRYDERAYLFMLAAIEFLQSRLEARRHVTGAELAWACRDLAVRQFGLLASDVLGYWGIRRTEDYGSIVFILVRAGLLSTQATDREEDFAAVYEFGEAFSEPYPWDGVADLVAVSR
jgi:uncharacterized repeat protein (TIGR04138 family)